MSEPTTEATHVNSSGPEVQAANVGDPSDPIKTPCGCGEQLAELERRVLLSDRVLKVVGQLAIVCALGVIYLLWQSWPKGE